MTDLMDALAAVVRGERHGANLLSTFDSEHVRRVADEHGVLVLIANQLAVWEDGNGPLRSILWGEYQRRAVRDVLRERDLQECLAQLQLENVPLLLIKGAQLAYTHYDRPDLRP